MRAPGATKLLAAIGSRMFPSFIRQLSLLPFSKDLFNKLPLYESISALCSPEQKRRGKKNPKKPKPYSLDQLYQQSFLCWKGIPKGISHMDNRACSSQGTATPPVPLQRPGDGAPHYPKILHRHLLEGLRPPRAQQVEERAFKNHKQGEKILFLALLQPNPCGFAHSCGWISFGRVILGWRVSLRTDPTHPQCLLRSP